MDEKIFEILTPTFTQEDQLDIAGFNISPGEIINTFKKLRYEVDNYNIDG